MWFSSRWVCRTGTRILGDENFEFRCLIPNLPDEIKLVEKAC